METLSTSEATQNSVRAERRAFLTLSHGQTGCWKDFMSLSASPASISVSSLTVWSESWRKSIFLACLARCSPIVRGGWVTCTDGRHMWVRGIQQEQVEQQYLLTVISHLHDGVLPRRFHPHRDRCHPELWKK